LKKKTNQLLSVTNQQRTCIKNYLVTLYLQHSHYHVVLWSLKIQTKDVNSAACLSTVTTISQPLPLKRLTQFLPWFKDI